MNENIREEKITIVGISYSDFTGSDGRTVKGYKVWFLTPSKKQNKLGYEVQEKFLNREDLNDLELLKNKKFPYDTVAKYQIVSLTDVPKFLDIKLL